MADYTTSIEIDAPPGDVFDFLVTDESMTIWMGRCAALEPRVGGDFAVDVAGYQIRGRCVEIDPPRRVAFSWGMAGSDDLPPGMSKVTFTLTPTARGTKVELVHSGLPDSEVDGHIRGWTHFLARLRDAALGVDPGVDHWVPA